MECSFIQLDIVEFYPSISENLLGEAISFARNHTDISSHTLEIIQHSRKSLLFDCKNTWVKRTNPDFDVTMGAYDGAEVCELVGLFLLSKIKSEFKYLNFGLYRDDGLGLVRKLSGPQTEKMRKDITKLFQSYGLRIEITCNLHQANFLDVTLNLQTGKFSPYRKPNDNPLYIHSKSNHPPNIKKQLPTMIAGRISSISCDIDEFNKVKEVYNTSLKNSGFNEPISYNTSQNNSQASSRQRNRKVIWFNPPYNERVKTNIGKNFLALLRKHFPPQHRYHTIFNKNKVKISYSCTPNMSQAISSHNKKILATSATPQEVNNPNQCNCRRPTDCPLDNKCLEECIVYEAKVTSNEGCKLYLGSTEASFKTRFTQHKASLANADKSSATALSKHVWDLKTRGISHEIKWRIVSKCKPYKCGSRRCDLCLTEKFEILKADKAEYLNRNSELMQKCRHSNKHKLGKVS